MKKSQDLYFWDLQMSQETLGNLYILIVCLMVFNAAFNTISVLSWMSVLLVSSKNHIFTILGEAREIFGVFHVKNHDFTPKKNIFFPILGGGGV
jgi:hypothetical protein